MAQEPALVEIGESKLMRLNNAIGGLRLGAWTLAGLSDAAYGGQTREGRRRLGKPVGHLPSTLRGQRQVLELSSKVERKTVKSSTSEMMGHMD